MSIDMAQFHQVFFEESFEGLEVMESGLLNLSKGNADADEVNTIFRAAHSIKGGSGTFGFGVVSDFTHLMETLLDEMRDGRRLVSQSAIDVLLRSVDFLREQLTAIQEEREVDANNLEIHEQALREELAQERDDSKQISVLNSEEKPSADSLTGFEGWNIAFSPHADLLMSGNDPVRMFRELAELGKVAVEIDFQGLPDLFNLDPEQCYLSWKLIVSAPVPKSEIDDIFAWVEDECDLAIQLIPNASQPGDMVNVEPSMQETTIVKPISEPFVSTPSKPLATVGAMTERKGALDQKAKSSGSIRVDTAKIDTLINMVGELVITQSMLSLIGEHFEINKLDQLKHGLSQLERHTRELQESVMNIRMLPISFVFNRFPRLVHDLSAKLGKKVGLELVGEQTEVDKTVVELLSDPLVHLVRNSLDHGIEMPEERLAAGKVETGTVILEAYHRGGNIVIEVADDGRGLDKDKLRAKAIEKGLIEMDAVLTDQQTYELIFMPGFSTAEKLTEVSGRGVGMDVVRKNIQALGGNIDIISEPGQGSTISIHLPLTLAILDGQSIAVGDERYIVPLGAIVESLNISEEHINRVAGRGETFRLRTEYLPIVRLHEIFHVASARATKLTDGLIVVVEGQGIRCGLFVDDLLGQQQVVIKSLEANYRRIDGVSGATILGDGSVALILDIPGLVRLANQ